MSAHNTNEKGEHPKKGKALPRKVQPGYVLLSKIREDLRQEKDEAGSYLLQSSEKTLDRRYSRFLQASGLPQDHHLDKELMNHAIPEGARPMQEAIYIQLDREDQPSLVTKIVERKVHDITAQDRAAFESLVRERIQRYSPDGRSSAAILESYKRSMRLDVYWLVARLMSELEKTIAASMQLSPEAQQRVLTILFQQVLNLQLELTLALHVEKKR